MASIRELDATELATVAGGLPPCVWWAAIGAVGGFIIVVAALS